MIEGLYSAASGMFAQQQRLDSVSNDVANINTTGYRSLRTGFQDLLYGRAGDGAARGVQVGAGVAARTVGRSTQAGALSPTGRTLDVAITGPGFLQVRGADGRIGLSRAGALQLDGQGRLGVPQGLLVPPVRLPRGTDPEQLTIAPDGTVGDGRRSFGRIQLVEVAAPGQLAGDGSGLLLPTVGSGAPRAATDSALQQGVLEASNVDMASAMVEMMDAQKSYALASRAVQTQDQLLEIANGVKR